MVDKSSSLTGLFHYKNLALIHVDLDISITLVLRLTFVFVIGCITPTFANV